MFGLAFNLLQEDWAEPFGSILDAICFFALRFDLIKVQFIVAGNAVSAFLVKMFRSLLALVFCGLAFIREVRGKGTQEARQQMPEVTLRPKAVAAPPRHVLLSPSPTRKGGEAAQQEQGMRKKWKPSRTVRLARKRAREAEEAAAAGAAA